MDPVTRDLEKNHKASSPDAAACAGDAELDLSSCDREPIHIPGSIQPHGFLLALDAASMLVCAASGTAADFLGRPLEEIFNRSLPEVLGDSLGRRIAAELTPDRLTTTPMLLASVCLAKGSESSGEHDAPALDFEVVAHRSGVHPDERILVEFERTDEKIDIEALNGRLYNFILAVRSFNTSEKINQAAVRELRALTGCDRVLLYNFDRDGHGLVIAEDNNGALPSYLGLRFPASDIPAQARRLYEMNRVRIIPNVDYDPSPLLSLSPSNSVEPAAEMDLSLSILRSVSPVHRAYMRNMGTICSMSVSIIIEGKLWGLASCHHHEARYVPLRLRLACDFIMQLVSSQIEAQTSALHLRRALQANAVQTRLLAAMAAHDSYMEGLVENPDLLLRLVNAEGVAVVTGESARLYGTTPTEPQVLALAAWLRQADGDSVFSTDGLGSIYPEGAEFAKQGSGVIAISISKIYSAYVIWFRRELIETVRWAGDPEKPADPRPGVPAAINTSVHPRHSFEEWQQIVSGRAQEWHTEEVDAALEFRGAVLEIVLKRAEELAHMAAGLQTANEELEAFSYSVSHDLRAPFRHISGFSEMLREEEAERMSAKGKHYLATIIDSARFAGQLVDSLLDFSRIARTRLVQEPVNMNAFVDREWQAVHYDEGAGRSIDFSRGELPCVLADPALLRQVLRNLLSNAVKYTGKQEQARIRLDARPHEQEFVFSVADNGVGFDAQYAGKLFGVFQRLHRVEDFEGTGIGLANVRRIVNRHGGRTWAEGEVGKGATFYFTLPYAYLPKGEKGC